MTKRERSRRDFGLRDQIRRSAMSVMSVMSNIAEGYESQTTAVFIKHLSIAKGSAGEFRFQLYVALDRDYVTRQGFYALRALSSQVARQLASFKAYLEGAPAQTPRRRER